MDEQSEKEQEVLVDGSNRHTDVYSTTYIGGGCAHHFYRISPKNSEVILADIQFQDGAIKDVGQVNGIMDENLIAIVIDRLRGFQSGDFKCRENALALTKLEEALMWLKERTRIREQRGVEGKSIV